MPDHLKASGIDVSPVIECLTTGDGFSSQLEYALWSGANAVSNARMLMKPALTRKQWKRNLGKIAKAARTIRDLAEQPIAVEPPVKADERPDEGNGRRFLCQVFLPTLGMQGISLPLTGKVGFDLPSLMNELIAETEQKSLAHLAHAQVLCACIIVEFYRQVHGTIPDRRNRPVQLACAALWKAAGGEPCGKYTAWERHLKVARGGECPEMATARMVFACA
jgi:hypothetical protein